MARILCVDDDAVAVFAKRDILEGAGHSVICSLSIDEALARLREGNFDAVVTDWRVGDDRGRTIVDAAKGSDGPPVVVVVSGYVSEAFQAAKPLADLYLEKPVDPGELVQIVDALLMSRHAG